MSENIQNIEKVLRLINQQKEIKYIAALEDKEHTDLEEWDAETQTLYVHRFLQWQQSEDDDMS